MTAKYRNNFIYNAERGFIFAYVPKVACTGWKSILRYMAGHENWLNQKLAHDRVNGGLRYLDLNGPDAALLQDPGIRKFAMVRDCYSRTLSSYLNKVHSRLPARPKEPGEDTFQMITRIIDTWRSKNLEPARYTEVNLEVFLLWIRDSGDPRSKNGHWESQAVMLRQPEVKFDILGRFENFSHDAAKILQAMECDVDFPTQKQTKFAPTNAGDKVKQFYTPASRALVDELFAKDFKTFGYSQNNSESV
jgi:hypothetical protein